MLGLCACVCVCGLGPYNLYTRFLFSMLSLFPLLPPQNSLRFRLSPPTLHRALRKWSHTLASNGADTFRRAALFMHFREALIQDIKIHDIWAFATHSLF